MNYSIIAYIIGWILNFEALFMALPCITAIFYHEHSGWAFFLSAMFCLLIPLVYGQTQKIQLFGCNVQERAVLQLH